MILRVKTLQVQSREGTLRDLIKTLDEISSGELEKRVLSTNGRLDGKFKIFVNGIASDTLDTTLAEGDDVVLFSVIDGG